MRDLTSLSEALSEWREGPVTQLLRQAMAKVLARRRRQLARFYLSGSPFPEEDRKAFRLVEQWVEDFFESSAEDVIEAMRDDDDD